MRPLRYRIQKKPGQVELRVFPAWSAGRYFAYLIAAGLVVPSLWLVGSAGPTLLRLGSFGLGTWISCSLLRDEVFGKVLQFYSDFVRVGRRRLQLSDLSDFGFGLWGHMLTPVLKFEHGREWVVVRSEVDEADALKLIRELQLAGAKLPGPSASIERERPSS